MVFAARLALVIAASGVLEPSASAQIAEIPFDAPPPYRVHWNMRTESSALMVNGDPGPSGTDVRWNHEHHAAGGVGDRPFMRYRLWDTDNVGQTLDATLGWSDAARPFRGDAEWADTTYYLRFRMRVVEPLRPYTGTFAGCDNDTQLKWFIWAAFGDRGTDRAIMMLHAGSEGGGDDATQTTLELRAGVSDAYARTLFSNGGWHDVQIAWRWGTEGVAFQRIYVDNDAEALPTAENLDFSGELMGAWPFPGSATLDNELFFGNAVNAGSCIDAGAAIDVMEVELDTAFDPTWHGSTPPPPDGGTSDGGTSDGGSPARDSGASAGDGGSRDAGGGPAVAPGDDGCGCRASSSSGSIAALVFVAFALVRRRRR